MRVVVIAFLCVSLLYSDTLQAESSTKSVRPRLTHFYRPISKAKPIFSVRRARIVSASVAKKTKTKRTIKPSKLAALWQKAKTTIYKRKRVIGEVSTASLLFAGTREVIHGARGLGPVGHSLLGAGTLGLGVYSTYELFSASSPYQRVDAAHGIAWSLQGASGFNRLIEPLITPMSLSLKDAGRFLGFSGGLLQTGVGAFRIRSGIKKHDRKSIILGSFDIAAGLTWAASATLATSGFLEAFIGLTAMRMIYQHKEQIYAYTEKPRAWIKDKYQSARSSLIEKKSRLKNRASGWLRQMNNRLKLN